MSNKLPGSAASTRDLVVSFLKLTVTRRRFIIEELLGPQAWPDMVFAGQWGALLRECREKGLEDRLVAMINA